MATVAHGAKQAELMGSGSSGPLRAPPWRKGSTGDRSLYGSPVTRGRADPAEGEQSLRPVGEAPACRGVLTKQGRPQDSEAGSRATGSRASAAASADTRLRSGHSGEPRRKGGTEGGSKEAEPTACELPGRAPRQLPAQRPPLADSGRLGQPRCYGPGRGRPCGHTECACEWSRVCNEVF